MNSFATETFFMYVAELNDQLESSWGRVDLLEKLDLQRFT
jgi:hypothetical protein